MALTNKDYKKIREELESCKRPIYFFHDDADGVASFLLLYRHVREGKGIIVKSTPKVSASFVSKVKDYGADKVFILDLAMADEGFLENVGVPVVWIDHHEPREDENVMYFNPRKRNPEDNTPASVLCYNAVKRDMWIAMIGAVGDWTLPKFAKEFSEKFPDLLPKTVKTPDEALFSTELGKLIRIISFILKGRTSDVMKCVRILTRTESPYEILNQTTAQGSFVYKRFEPIDKRYGELMSKAGKSEVKKGMRVFTYKEDSMSFTKDIANELLYRHPENPVVVGREKGDEVKLSIRAANHIIPPILQKALRGIEGYGGGHEHACGACVKTHDFERFIDNLHAGFFS